MSSAAVSLPESSQQWRQSKLVSVCSFILGTEFCERLAFYGIAVNLPIYLTSVMQLSVADSSIHTSLFSGTCYLTPLLGAWLADGHWGRYKTIIVFSTVYCMGMALLASTSIIPGLGPHHGSSVHPLHFALLYIALYTVALGTGGIKSNVSAFGADQFDEGNPDEMEQKKSFFNWFYFSVNVGSITAISIIVEIQSWSWGLGFAIPAIAMALAILVFLSGSHKYKFEQPTGSSIVTAVKISGCAAVEYLGSFVSSSTDHETSRLRRPHENESASEEDSVAQPLNTDSTGDEQGTLMRHRSDLLNRVQEKHGYTAAEVAAVRAVLRLLPVFFLTMSYFTLYSHMFSIFVLQV